MFSSFPNSLIVPDGRTVARRSCAVPKTTEAGEKRVASMTDQHGGGKLAALEERMAGYNLRGQWAMEANRPQTVRKGPQNQVFVEPSSSGVGHVWQWDKMTPFLDASLEALSDSYTARRTLIMNNPALPRGTTHTLLASMQIIGPGEMAWAHRHTISAFRFTILGGADVYTVVDGVPLTMEPYDLILTPSWMWHDHHNKSARSAIWLDGLDVPFTLALNQNFYEELGAAAQEQRPGPAPSPLLRPAGQASDARHGPFRYPWAETRPRLEALAAEGTVHPHDGVALDYVNPITGGSTLPTIACRIHWLPPGFEGKAHRRTASAVFFAVEGQGTAVIENKELHWGRHDTVAVPNWSWLRLSNRSRTEPAILFSMSDAPILRTFGLYREESEADRHP
jgi:1-hydroxy-2-naphthoate dioxygenase